MFSPTAKSLRAIADRWRAGELSADAKAAEKLALLRAAGAPPAGRACDSPVSVSASAMGTSTEDDSPRSPARRDGVAGGDGCDGCGGVAAPVCTPAPVPRRAAAPTPGSSRGAAVLLSPAASALRSISHDYRHGLITEEQRSAFKDSLLRSAAVITPARTPCQRRAASRQLMQTHPELHVQRPQQQHAERVHAPVGSHLDEQLRWAAGDGDDAGVARSDLSAAFNNDLATACFFSARPDSDVACVDSSAAFARGVHASGAVAHRVPVTSRRHRLPPLPAGPPLSAATAAAAAVAAAMAGAASDASPMSAAASPDVGSCWTVQPSSSHRSPALGGCRVPRAAVPAPLVEIARGATASSSEGGGPPCVPPAPPGGMYRVPAPPARRVSAAEPARGGRHFRVRTQGPAAPARSDADCAVGQGGGAAAAAATSAASAAVTMRPRLPSTSHRCAGGAKNGTADDSYITVSLDDDDGCGGMHCRIGGGGGDGAGAPPAPAAAAVVGFENYPTFWGSFEPLAQGAGRPPRRHWTHALPPREATPGARATPSPPPSAGGGHAGGQSGGVARAAVFAAARHGRGDAVSVALAAGMPPDARDEFGNTLLLLACMNGRKGAVEACLAAGAEIDAVNASGNCGLHFAFAFGHSELAGYLISRGANDAIVNEYGASVYDQ